MFLHPHQTMIFQRAFTQQKMHHAWLLSGPKGIGKSTWARTQTAAMLGVPLEHLIYHTHFLPLGNEDEPLTIDRLREAKSFFTYKSLEDKPKIVLIEDIDEVNEKTANALLKILEEPPEKTIFMLVSHRPYGLLPTIHSRTITLRFNILSAEETKFLVKNQHSVIPDDVYEKASQLYPGQPGMILAYVEQGFHEVVLRFEMALAGHSIDELEKEKETKDFFNVLAKLIHSHRVVAAINGKNTYTEKVSQVSENRIIHDSFLYNLDKKTTMNVLINCHS